MVPLEDFVQTVTGSSGFIGSHLCARLPRADGVYGIDLQEPAAPPPYNHITADIRRLDRMRVIAQTTGPSGVLYHLAASAEVLTPWPDIPALLSTNLEGIYNVLEAFSPRLVVFASTSSVYGNAEVELTDPARGALDPLCMYAVSKRAGELLLGDWVRQSGNSAVVLRLGNVVGPHCRGLIPFLANHAKRHHGDGVAARLRGAGRLVRDYVPVDYVTRIMMAAARAEWAPGSLSTFNVGTGRGMSNRGLAAIVQQVLDELGFPLTATFDDPPGPGEAQEVVLNVEATVRQFGIAPPGPEAIRTAVEESARGCFGQVAVGNNA